MSRRGRSRRGVALAATLLAALMMGSGARAEARLDADAFGGLEARALGPAVMSGRITALDAVVGEKLTIWVGAASGGVWKSTDGGHAFKPVFDKQTQSIGAIAIDLGKPDTVWVGTGETCVRNSVSVGSGVYRTTDGGDNWQHLGLAATERIARILVHPKERDTALVCATGPLWSAGDERGVFRTTDAGKTWTKALYVDADTGCADLARDPQDPSIVYAGMWTFRRSPDFFRSGGPGSALYKSSDGGVTWRKITRGLPDGEKGRIALAVAPSRPNRVYATVEAKETALYRSDDLGESWARVNDSMSVQSRPFYFSHLAVDPVDFERVYRPGFNLAVSTDGGKTFQGTLGSNHPDHHALWIHPKDPQTMVLGTDGGVYITHDRGGHWRQVRSLPVSQFYHVSYDMAWPYNVYGGLQDNGTWTGPSRTSGGIGPQHWKVVGAGDGMWAFVDPHDEDVVYVEYQGGHIQRTRKSTGETKEIAPFPKADEPEYRFNWNAPIHMSRSTPGTMYLGGQFLFRSRDRGESWERISPDLTTDDKAKQRQDQSGGLTIDNSTAENHCAIYTVSESPRDPKVIWTGTDDGNLQVTRDGGTTWTNVAGNVQGLPKGTWVSRVEAGRFADGTAYATFDGHRTGDMATRVYRTEDFGATWTSLATPDVSGFAWVVIEDLVRPDLLFLGTETGLYLSIDRGTSWAAFRNGMPPVPVHDLAIHPREHDLLVATHGRGIYVLDDLTPLRALTPEVLEADAAILPSRPAVRVLPAGEQRFDGDDTWVALSPPESATIVYWLKKRPLFGEMKVEVYDAAGKLLTTFPASRRRGLNRVAWPMRLAPPKVSPAATLVPNFYAFVGPRQPAGSYSAKLIHGTKTYEGAFTLVEDPRSTHTKEDMAEQQRVVMRLYKDVESLAAVVDAATDLRDQARKAAKELGEKDALGRKIAAFGDKVEAFRQSLVASRENTPLSGEKKLREKLGDLYGAVNGFDGRPTDSQIRYMEALEQQVAKADADLTALATEAARFDRDLTAKKLPPLRRMTREAWEEKQKGGA